MCRRLCLTLLTASLLLFPARAVELEYGVLDPEELYEEEGLPDVEEDTDSVEDSGILPFSANISGSYGVGSSNLSLFSGVAGKLGLGVHYVYYRSGQYSYVIAYSREITWNGTRFTAPSVETLTYYSYSGSGSQPTWTHSTETGWYVQPNNYLVYSDIGPYPQLIERRGSDYELAALCGMASFALFALWRSMRRALDQRFIGR